MNEKVCNDCIHLDVCRAFSVENVVNACAQYCKYYKTTNVGEAYLRGWLAGQKDAEDRMVKSEFSISPDGGFWSLSVEKSDNEIRASETCFNELYERLTSLEQKLSKLLPE